MSNIFLPETGPEKTALTGGFEFTLGFRKNCVIKKLLNPKG